jgi:hypothetical protein
MVGYIGASVVGLSTVSADIDGTVTADGLTVDGDAVINDTIAQLQLMESDTTDVNSVIKTTAGQFRIQTINDAASSTTNRFIIDHATGDVSFYEDTGSTVKMFWDASAESLGIGTSSPDAKLTIDTDAHLKAASGYSTLYFNGVTTASSRYASIKKNFDSPFDLTINASSSASGAPMIFNSSSATEAMRIDSSGNLLVGTTDSAGGTSGTTQGIALSAGSFGGFIGATRSANKVASLNRTTSDGDIIDFRKNGTTVGVIGVDNGDNLYVGAKVSGHAGFYFGNLNASPMAGGTRVDNSVDLGSSSYRYDDVFATNGTIQTSDEREKQQIASLTDAEITAAKAISKLFKTFKWNDAVTEKGDNARTHAGVIAQQVETAMSDAGLDAVNYAFFISTTWWETQTEVAAVEAVEAQDAVYEDVVIPAVEEVLDEDGNVVTEAQPERTEQRLVSEAVQAVEAQEAYTRTDTYDTQEEAPEGATERNRKGIRYPELLSFIGAATEQRLTSIEARLDALEAN